MSVEPIRWRGDRMQLLEQRRLPRDVVYVDCFTASDVARAIREMVVRGAPAIGVAAAFGMAIADDRASAAAELKAARPTAVNLAWAVDRMLRASGDLVVEAQKMFDEDIAANHRIGRFGAELLGDRAT